MFFDQTTIMYFAEVLDNFKTLEERCSSINLSLDEYKKIDAHIHADRVFNGQQRELFGKLHRYCMLISNSPQVDVQIKLSRNGKINGANFICKNGEALLKSISIEPDQDKSTFYPMNTIIPDDEWGSFTNSESVLFDKEFDIRTELSFIVSKNDFDYEICYICTDRYSKPELFVSWEDYLHEERNRILRFLRLKEFPRFKFGEWSPLDERICDFVEL